MEKDKNPLIEILKKKGYIKPLPGYLIKKKKKKNK